MQTQLPELVGKLQQADAGKGQGRPHVFVCGLSEMVNDVRDLLKQSLGYDRKHIHSERYD